MIQRFLFLFFLTGVGGGGGSRQKSLIKKKKKIEPYQYKNISYRNIALCVSISYSRVSSQEPLINQGHVSVGRDKKSTKVSFSANSNQYVKQREYILKEMAASQRYKTIFQYLSMLIMC